MKHWQKIVNTMAFVVMVLAIADITFTIANGLWEAFWAVVRVKYQVMTGVVMTYRLSLFKPLLIMLLAGSLPSIKSYVERLRVRYIGMASIIFMFLINSVELIGLRGGDPTFIFLFYIIFALVFTPFLLPKWHPYELMLLGILSTLLAVYTLNFNFYYSSVYITILFLGILSFTAGYILLKGMTKRLENLVKVEFVLLAIAVICRACVTGGQIL